MRRFLILFIVFACLCLQQAIGQTILTVREIKSNEPVEGATISIQGLSESINSVYITDSNGIVNTAISFPLIYAVQHIGYELKSDTLHAGEEAIIQLNESLQALDDVVITGQYESQSAKNSVYQVRSISSERISAQGATNVQEILSNELNIRFSRDNATGVSGLGLQGLGGQYVKVLLDGVPITGKSGTGNEVDINQINVLNIDRIEIVEGPMAVSYGADALAGVINIITNKASDNELDIQTIIHEETIGNEYQFFDGGIHTPALELGIKASDHWDIRLNSRINQFGGWIGTQDKRNKSWYPKTQYLNGGIVEFAIKNFKIYYRIDQLDEKIFNNGPINGGSSLKDEYAIDTVFHAKRWMHQIQSEAKIGKAGLNSVVSFSDYSRISESHRTILITDEEHNFKLLNNVFYQSWFTRQTLNKFIQNDWLSTQIGMDANLEKIGGSTLSEGDKSIVDLGVFLSGEIVLQNLKIRPGIRVTHNSNFSSVPAPSINFKYDFGDQLSLRIGYGRGFRAPSARELYHEFIDSNHNIQGNADLKPEFSHNVNSDVNYKFPGIPLSLNGSAFYNHIEDQITYFIPSQGNAVTTYINLDQYKTAGLVFSAEYKNQSLSINSGISYIGRYQQESEIVDAEVPEFLFSPQVNTNIIYNLGSSGFKLAGFYKFNGTNKNYQLVADEEGNYEPRMSTISHYQNLDLTISKTFMNSLSISVGVKNLFDVTSLNNPGNSGGTHGGKSNYPVSYGRSYFLQLKYHFIKKKLTNE